MQFERDFLTDKSDESLLDELRRVAKDLGKNSLTKVEFDSRAKGISSSGVEKRFDGWNEAVIRAGLQPSNRKNIPIDEIFDDIERVWKKLGRRPTYDEFSQLSKFSVAPLVKHFGGYIAGIEAFIRDREKSDGTPLTTPPSPISASSTHISTVSTIRKRPSYGRLINFRGMQHAPMNELGVVFLFGMLAKELGFVVEAISASFPDCEAKRLIESGDQWERVLIEFEYKSGNFQKHGHSVDECDLIVCWEHDWEECPLEVLELSMVIQNSSEVIG